MYYSASTGGFYLAEIHGSNIPADAVEITDAAHAELLDAQSNGAAIVAGPTGAPVASYPEVTLESSIAAKLAGLAAHRYQVETGGITVNNNAIATDRETQAMLTGAWVTVQANPEILIDWKCDNGWTQIDKSTVETLSALVATHVQACFSNEKAHSAAISALATIDAVNAYDFTTGWPE